MSFMILITIVSNISLNDRGTIAYSLHPPPCSLINLFLSFLYRSISNDIHLKIETGSKRIHSLLNKTFNVIQLSKSSPEWSKYMEFINDIVINGLEKSVLASLCHIFNRMVAGNLQVCVATHCTHVTNTRHQTWK